MDNAHDLNVILSSRVPIVLVESQDETRFLDLLKDLVRGAFGGQYRPLFRWSVTEGLQRLDIDMAPQNLNSEPTQVLKHIRSVESPAIYVLLDFHPYLSDPVHVRLLKDIAVGSEDGSRTLILLSHKLDIPPELERLSARFELALPDDTEREMIVMQVVREWSAERKRNATTDPKAMQLLVRNLAGLTRATPSASRTEPCAPAVRSRPVTCPTSCRRNMNY